MTAKERLHLLLAKGYFPEPLPPPFTTRGFAKVAPTIPSAIKPSQSVLKNGFGVEAFAIPKTGHSRRIFGIPNPFPQLGLSKLIADEWPALSAHFSAAKLSRSVPRFRKTKRRAVEPTSREKLDERHSLLSSGFRYVLQTDIAQYYPTIYSHSLSWALHGKAVAKAQQNNKTLLGNQLDVAARVCHLRQTIGIPIGPDTSAVLAEVIGTAMDKLLIHGDKSASRGYRYVDDYYFFCDTRGSAEALLTKIAAATSQFELRLSDTKTRIYPIAELHNSSWVNQLRRYDVSRRPSAQRNDLLAYFDSAFSLASSVNDSSVMKYAVKRLSSTLINESNFRIYQSELARAAISYPICLPDIARVFTTYAYHGFPIDRAAMRRLIETLVIEHSPLQHDLEVAWALWLALALQIKLQKSVGEVVQNVGSSVCRILALDLRANGLLSHSLPMLRSMKFHSDHLYDDRWLLAYEAPVHGWIKGTKHIATDAWFSQLQAKKVRFYNRNYKLKPLFQRKPVSGEAAGLNEAQLALLADQSVKQLSRSAFDPALFLRFVIDVGGYENREFDDDEDGD